MSALIAVVGTLLGARVAVADSVWVQSYQRGSASEACVAQVGETPWQAGWGTDASWKPSWEQWANAGKGGWVCTRSITWARDSAEQAHSLGDIGPGGGLVFLIADGKTFEMAPNTWSAGGVNESTGDNWCSNTSTSIAGIFGTDIGTGSANTDLMLAGTPAACASGAGVSARAYSGGGFSDWFLPSQDELNAMYGFRNSIVDTAKFGFASDNYWSSSQFDLDGEFAGRQDFRTGNQLEDPKYYTMRVRPVRAF